MGNGYFSGPKTMKDDKTHTTSQSFRRWSCMVEHVETESYCRYENDRAEFFIKFLYPLWHSSFSCKSRSSVCDFFLECFS